MAFSYDAADRRSSLTLPNGIVLSYTYDNNSRVTAMSWPLGLSQVGDLECMYDSDGRVIEKSGSMAATNLPQAVTGNTFNVANEMVTFDGAALSYDANGNLASDGTNTYTWDARNHLASIAGANSASFVYDPFGRRASKAVNGAVTEFLYDGLNPVEELDGSSPPNVTAGMLTGLGIDEYFQRADSNGAVSYLTDMLGSTLALADSSGNLNTT